MKGLTAHNLSLKANDGNHVQVYSSLDPKVIAKHFAEMKAAGISAVSCQRFVVALQDSDTKAYDENAVWTQRYDRLFALMKTEAAKQGIKLYVSYDISGAEETTYIDTIRKDWQHLKDTGFVNSDTYLMEGQKPAIQLWGLGFTTRPGEPQETLNFIHELQQQNGGAVVVGGVPTGWRTLDGDAKSDSAWGNVYRALDVISPWIAGRFALQETTGIDSKGDPLTVPDADTFLKGLIRADLAEAQRAGVAYQPVVIPGFSWNNEYQARLGKPTPEPMGNIQIPREGGRFLWKQFQILSDLMQEYRAINGGMTVGVWDEWDEATNISPCETDRTKFPAATPIVTGTEGSYLFAGKALPGDWYIQLTKKFSDYFFKGKSFGDLSTLFPSFTQNAKASSTDRLVEQRASYATPDAHVGSR